MWEEKQWENGEQITSTDIDQNASSLWGCLHARFRIYLLCEYKPATLKWVCGGLKVKCIISAPTNCPKLARHKSVDSTIDVILEPVCLIQTSRFAGRCCSITLWPLGDYFPQLHKVLCGRRQRRITPSGILQSNGRLFYTNGADITHFTFNVNEQLMPHIVAFVCITMHIYNIFFGSTNAWWSWWWLWHITVCGNLHNC